MNQQILFKKINAQRLLKNTKIKTLKSQPALYNSKGIVKWIPWEPLTAGITIPSGNAKGIYFNPSGEFYSTKDVGIGFGISLSPEDFGILAVIHELAHIAGVIPRDGGADRTLSYENNRKVYVLCFVLNPRFHNRNQPIETPSGGISTEVEFRPLIPTYQSMSDADWGFFLLNWLSAWARQYETSVRIVGE